MANKKWGPFQLGAGRTLIMGVLNVTPDSFSDGGQFLEPDKAVEHACRMVADGADIIDIGGQSTRPGSDPVAPEAELRRLRPVLDKLAGEIAAPISIDTFEPQVAETCLELGAAAINDVSGLRNPAMIEVAARHKAPVVLMHMRGTPKTMQQDISYRDVVEDLKTFFADRVGEAREKGVQEIMIDPGIGFGKTARHNLEILKRLGEFKELGLPVLVGPSRKSFIGKIAGDPAGQRLEGTLAAVSVAVMNGADAVRVHDVEACRRAVRIVDAVRKNLMDKVILQEMEFPCRLGVSASERQDPQRILVDVEWFADLSDAAARDDLAASVDYEEVYSQVQEVVTGREYKLLETVTEKIAQRLLERFALERVSVSVSVKKLAPLGPGGMKYAAVEMTRSKDD